ncbi:heparinase II/III domain-containing protein, partial [Pseudactinotalea suaedae]
LRLEGGGWGHHYHCPTHSVPLGFDASRPDEHRCPVDGENVVGDHMDAAWRSRLSNEAIEGALACAEVWLANGDERCRRLAVDVLEAYAARYPLIEPHGSIVGLGRVHGTALEESVWGIKLARLVDDLRPALSDAERSTADTLLGQVLDQVTGELMGKIHNIECWHLASQINLAAVAGRDDLVAAAITGPYGLQAQLDAGIREDGWWSEGSPHYHFYMLTAVALACRALRRSHPALVDSARVRAMVDTPLTMLRPDLSLAALNDGWFDISETNGVAQYTPLYELAWTIWSSDSVLALLGALYGAGVPRTDPEALSHGPAPELLNGSHPLPPTRGVHEASGYAVLADDDRSLLLKFGPHGGGHGHPDKLQLDLHVRGVRVAPDLGSPAYNSPLQGPWIRQTLSHNTATIAGLSQPPAAGTLLSAPHAARPGAAAVLDAGVTWSDLDRADAGSWLHEPRLPFPPEYEDAGMRRVVLWSQHGYLVDIVSTRVPSRARVDLGWRLRGELTTASSPLESSDWQPLGDTQRDYLRSVRELPAGPWQGSWTVDGVTTRLWALDPPGSRTLVTECPGAHLDEEQTMVLRSAAAEETTFVTVIDSGGAVQDVSTVPDGRIVVTLGDGVECWELRGCSDEVPGTTVRSDGGRTGAPLQVLLRPWLVDIAVPDHSKAGR